MILCRMTPRGSEIVQLFQMLGNKALNIVRRLQNLDLNKIPSSGNSEPSITERTSQGHIHTFPVHKNFNS